MDFHPKSSSSGFHTSQPSQGAPAVFVLGRETVHETHVHFHNTEAQKGLHHLLGNKEEFHDLMAKVEAGGHGEFTNAAGHHFVLHEHKGEITVSKPGDHILLK